MGIFSRSVPVRPLIAVLSVSLVLYVSVMNLKLDKTSWEKSVSETSSYFHRSGKVVVLLSNQRSGSSFVGEFFNRFHDGYYLYEPLLPFTPNCSRLYEERLQVLKSLSQCDFRHLIQSYKEAKEVFHVRSHPECLGRHICAPGSHSPLLQRYSNLCNSIEENYQGSVSVAQLNNPQDITSKITGDIDFASRKSCGFPLNLTLLSSLCHSAQLVSFKILRVCSLSALEGISKQLTEEGSQFYVIELVRDPRAIVNSALKLELKMSRLDTRLNTLCGRWRSNMDYEEQQIRNTTTHGGIVSSGRYMRIRYEDIAVNPVKGAERIYKHLGMPLPEEVKDWIEESSLDPGTKIAQLKKSTASGLLTEEEIKKIRKRIAKLVSARNNPYGTVRDPQVVLKKWRKNLSMNTIKRIQMKCGDVMKRMGYKLIESEEERKNVDMQLW